MYQQAIESGTECQQSNVLSSWREVFAALGGLLARYQSEGIGDFAKEEQALLSRLQELAWVWTGDGAVCVDVTAVDELRGVCDGFGGTFEVGCVSLSKVRQVPGMPTLAVESVCSEVLECGTWRVGGMGEGVQQIRTDAGVELRRAGWFLDDGKTRRRIASLTELEQHLEEIAND